ncbi:MAG: HDOD domain-containing protein [Gammaproteobacteria bacterium]|nr:HDOD domain-containing protein [Gammaproteobacteria bacterium]
MSQTEVSEKTAIQQRDPRELLHIFAQAEDLPTLPEVAVRLQEMVNDADSSAKDVARLIEEDPAITTKVLKMVNSVFYAPARGEEITRLTPAIARLGFITVTNIALSTSVFQAFSRAQKPIFDRREFWRHSVCVGVVTSVLYDYSVNRIDQRITRDVAHLSGIVHDMGKILFERYANPEYHQAIKSAETEDIPSIKEEARFIGMGHDQAGAWLGGRWKLGLDLLSVIRWHHDPLSCPEEEFQPLVKLVHMADYICHNQGMGDSGNPCPSYDHRVREELDLTPDKIGEIMGIVETETANSEILLSLTD